MTREPVKIARPLSRRRALRAAPVLLAGIGAAACATGGGGAAKPAVPAAPSLPSPRTVELWSQWGSGMTLDTQARLVQRYQQLNPGVTVNTAVAPMVSGAPEKTITATAAGSPPDVGIFDRFVIASFVAKDTFTPLTDLARRDAITEKDYYPFAWNEATYKNKLYALPFQTGIRGLFVNLAHLRDVGVRPDQLPKTLTELDQLAVRLTQQGGESFSRVGFMPWVGNSHFYTWGWLFGGEFFDDKANRCTANHAKNIEALNWVAGYAQRLGDARSRAFQNGFAQAPGGGFGGGLQSFWHDTQALMDTIATAVPQLEYDTMPLPPAPGQTKTSSWAGGFGYFVPRGVKNSEVGWHLAKFLGGDEGELAWAQGTAVFPVRVNVAKAPYFQERAARDKRFKVFLDLLPIARSRPVTPVAQLMLDELNAAVDNVRKGASLPKDALDAVTQKVNAELAALGG
ncbi:MAG TPA: extracellular solute-binding protein [Chloroflexota bacterium]|nr:extracellular solute-binding protein [Chloroflexota bacterium]